MSRASSDTSPGARILAALTPAPAVDVKELVEAATGVMARLVVAFPDAETYPPTVRLAAALAAFEKAEAERDEALNQLNSVEHSVDVLEKRNRELLDKLAKAEADALRRAAALAHTSINQGGLAKSFAHFLRVKDHDAYHQAVREYEAAILAMIPRDGA